MHENLDFFKGLNYDFLVGLGLSLLAGFLIGLERESKDKPAGISTHAFVIGGIYDLYILICSCRSKLNIKNCCLKFSQE